MKSTRLHRRIKCDYDCILLDFNGNGYLGQVNDMSLGGAMVNVSGSVIFKEGDTCQLMLGRTSVLPQKRNGRIAWIDSQKQTLGLSFMW